MPRPRPSTTPLAVLAVLPALALALVLAAAAPAGARAQVAPAGLTLQDAAVGQSGTDLRIVWRLKDPLDAATLRDPDRSLCVRLWRGKRRAPRSAVCVVPRGRRAALARTTFAADGQPRTTKRLEATVRRRNDRTVVALLAPAAAGLPPGPFRWRARSTWADPAGCGPGAEAEPPAAEHSGSVGRSGGAEPAQIGGPCVDAVPATGTRDATIAASRVVGCVPSGASYRTRGPANRRAVAFGFDDGPSSFTPGFLSALTRADAHATFFEIGQNTAGRAAAMRAILAQGSTIGNHSWSHPNLAGGGGFAAGQLSSTSRAIERATGFRPCLFRPPYGATSANLASIARSQRMLTIEWDVDPRDWTTPGTGAIVSRVLGAIHPGAIMVMHDGGGPRGQTLAALPAIFATLKRRGYDIVTVEELLGLKLRYGA